MRYEVANLHRHLNLAGQNLGVGKTWRTLPEYPDRQYKYQSDKSNSAKGSWFMTKLQQQQQQGFARTTTCGTAKSGRGSHRRQTSEREEEEEEEEGEEEEEKEEGKMGSLLLARAGLSSYLYRPVRRASICLWGWYPHHHK